MFRIRTVAVSVMAVVFSILAQTTFAQTGSGIAGVVKDTSGAVLPGVTVEASSPALIEKVRTVATDDKGEYKFLNLLTGTYTVTFSLPGFSTVKREGVALTAAFTATVNADLRVGAVEETVTVSSESPIVDTHSVVRQTPVTAQMLQELPTGRLQQGLAALVVGVVIAPNLQDVGGTRGETSMGLQVHNSRAGEMADLYDGMRYNSMAGPGGGGSGLKINMGSVQEINLGLSGNSAEYEMGGVQFNVIPKDGGNKFSGTFFVNGANRSLQSDNLDDALRARGLKDVGRVVKLWDINPTLGGPIAKDKLWFYLGYRHWGNSLGVAGNYFNLTPKAFTYTPDLTKQGFDDTINRSATLRLSWQASTKQKLNIFYDNERRCTCHVGISTQSTGSIVSPEAASYRTYEPDYQAQVTWVMPATNRLLFEAGASATIFNFPSNPEPGVTNDIVATTEASIGLLFRAANTYTPEANNHVFNQRASVSYITGSHAFKAGVQMQQGTRFNSTTSNSDINIRLLNGAPSQITQRATPYSTIDKLKMNFGAFVQDQWTIKRLTLSPGLRFDYLNSYVPASDNPATRFVPARSYAAIENVPNWKDINPRFGAVYDLFGNGTTALKASVNRYVAGHTTGIARLLNPVEAAVTSVTRTWTSTSGLFNPYLDCDLNNPLANGSATGSCGQISNLSFGKPLANLTYDPDVLVGWGKRGFDWDISAGIQQELSPGYSVSATYSRTAYGNALANGVNNVFGFPVPLKNQSATPADYDPYCIKAPVDARLPGGGGYQICGLYDIKPAKFGQVQNFASFATSFGKDYSEVFDGGDFAVTARLPAGGRLSGGVSTGRVHFNSCTVVNSSGDLRFCDVKQPLQTQGKVSWTYPLPWGLQTSGVFQNLPGSVLRAQYVARNAEIAPSLGRNLAAGANGTVTVDLIAPESMYEPRRSQLDLRLVRSMKLGRTRLQPQFDAYNVLNTNSVQVVNTTFGPSWLTPTVVLPGRLIKFGLQMDF